jgi:hypothetical protein
MTHKVYASKSVTALLRAQKRRPHGRQRNVRRVWKLRAIDIVHPGAFLDPDCPGERHVGRLKTVRPS